MATRLLIGTGNKGKLDEYRDLLKGRNVELVTPSDLGITDDAPEESDTLEENSLVKANFYWQRARIPVITDDGGVEVNALGGEPGVHTRRWIGRWMSDEEIRAELLRRLKPFPPDRWTAQLRNVATLRISDTMNFQGEGALSGIIRPGNGPMLEGFPVETILWIPGYNKLYGEFTPSEREKVSNRAQAFRQILPYLSQYVL